jgi:predicted ATPase/DNA-binding CsgD family transcriptional regulator
MTSFVGRRREVAEVRTKLTASRVVSLVGPGGVGKTRLAIRAAADVVRGFPDGAWLVELAEVREPALVGHAVMAALDLRDQAAPEPLALLRSYLCDKRLLLVVDNCEHLLAAAGRLLAEIVRDAPAVRVIATSREPLSLPGEHVVPVPPLDLPPPDSTAPLPRLRHNEAVRLFAERAAAASGAFSVTATNQGAVVDLCRRLDGLPLAIELAAVRTRVLTVQQILDRLTDRFGLLTGGGPAALPRHQTLRTTIDWSYDLLTGAEQTLLRRLCVFAGRFTLDDVESVCTGEDMPAAQALDALSSLVDKSLVVKEDVRDVACYRLHETMRQYTGLKLRAAGEVDAVERRCAEYYRETCQRLIVEARYRLVEWLEWMDLQIDNVRSVLQQCVARHDTQRGLDLASFVGWYWVTRANSEGSRWFDQLLASDGDSSRAHPLAHFMCGFLAILRSDPVAARPALERAATTAAHIGQASLRSQALSLAAIATHITGDRPAARHMLDEARTLAGGLDEYPVTIAVLQARALIGLFEDDLDAVRSAATEGVQRSRAVGDLYALEMMLLNLGLAALIDGNPDESKPLFIEALQIARRIDDRVAQYLLLDALGCQAAGTGQPRLATQLIGAAETAQAGIGPTVFPYLAPLVAEAKEATTAALGTPAFQAEFEAGKRLSRATAIGLALDEPTRVAAPPSGDTGAPLANREAQVAQLVADGLSNKQIAARLLISEHTVDSHIRNIMNKLGVSARAQIAAWMAAAER